MVIRPGGLSYSLPPPPLTQPSNSKATGSALLVCEGAIGSKHEVGDKTGIVREQPTPQVPRPSRRLQNYCSREE